MKKVRLVGLAMLVGIFSINIANAQSGDEYTLDMNSGRLLVKEVNKVEFFGGSDKGVVIKRVGKNRETSERAKGLKLINGLGLEDNTGIGLSAEKEGDLTTILELSMNSESSYVIQVPKGVIVVYDHSSPHGKSVSFSDITGEMEVTTNHSGIKLDNVTGPMTINTVHGNVEGNFSTVNQANPIAIVSTHGTIDLAIPENTKANFKINTGRGEIYTDLDIEMQRSKDSMKKYGSGDVIGKLNGGGVSFNIQSSHGSIYLRKK